MGLAGHVGEIAAAIGAWELARWVTLRALKARWQRSVGGFLRRHGVQLEQFRFIDRVWVRQALLQDPELDRAAAERAAQEGVPMLVVRQRVEGWLDEIVPYFNLFSYYKLGAAVARAAVRVCYELVFDASALEQARAAVPAGAVTVYVANHRSNADYVVLSVGTLRQVALSYAVGEWALVWPLDALFRSFGSYFVRRGEKDPLYHRVLARYLQLVASRGLTTAFFLEGRLSRDGALGAPKIGLLDYLVGILRSEPDREIVFIPVGINYDRVLEDRNLTREAPPTMGQKLGSLAKILARLPGVVTTLGVRAALRSHRKYGYAAVGFGEPVSLRTLMPDAAEVAGLPDAERRPRVAALADRLLDRVGAVVPATPVSLVCRALLAGEDTVAGLRGAVREQLEDLRVEGRPVAQGRAFESLRGPAASHGVAEKNALDGDIHAAEEAERTVDLALVLLVRRGLVLREGDRVRVAPGQEVLATYYARSLEPPRSRAARPAAEALGG